MADKPVAVLTARVQIDKQESFKQFERDFKEYQKQADKNAIVYEITGDDSDLEKILKKLEDSDLKLGVDVVLKGKNSKKLQDQIKKMLEAASMGVKSTDLGIVDKIKGELAAADKEITKQQKKLEELNKKKKEASKNQKSATDIYKQIEASHKKLGNMFIDPDDKAQAKKYNDEVKHLRDLIAAYKELATATEYKTKESNLNEFLRNEESVVKQYKGNASNILGNALTKANQEQIVQVENVLRELQTKREEIQKRLNEAIEEAQKRVKENTSTSESSESESSTKKSEDKNYKVTLDTTEAEASLENINNKLDDISKPRALSIDNLKETEEIVNNIVSALNSIGQTVSPSQKNDLTEVISKMMSADKMMSKADANSLRERVMFYNKQTQDYSNPYVFGGADNISLELEKQIKKNDKTKYNSYFHSHPEKLAALSIVQFDKANKQFNGDLIKMMEEGYEEAIIAAREEVQIFDVEKFRKKFGDYFNLANKEKATKNLHEASQNLFTEYYQDQFKNGNIKIDWENLLSDVIPSYHEAHKEISKQLKNNDFTTLFVDYLKQSEKDVNGVYQDNVGSFKERLRSFIMERFQIDPKFKKSISEKLIEFYRQLSPSRDEFQKIYQTLTPDIIKQGLGLDDFDWNEFQKTIPINEFRENYKHLYQQMGEELSKDSDQGNGIKIPVSVIPDINDPKAFINEASKKLEGYFVEVGILPVTGDEAEIQRRISLIADAFKKALGAAEEGGASLVDAAEEGTAKEQKSESPSKVAEALGEYWGQGYAKGILEHKDDVEKAVAELVKTGRLTVQTLMTDLAFNIKDKDEYKDLLIPVQNVINKNKVYHKAGDLKDLREQYKLLRMINKDIQGRKNNEAPLLNASLEELEKDKREILSLNSALESVADSVEYISKSDFLKRFGNAFPEQIQQALDSVSTGVKNVKKETNKAVKISVKDFADLTNRINATNTTIEELEGLISKFQQLTPNQNNAKEMASYYEAYKKLTAVAKELGYEYDKTSNKLVKIDEATSKVNTKTKEEAKAQEKTSQTAKESIKTTEQTTQATGKLAEGYEYVSEKVNELNNRLQKYIDLSKTANQADRTMYDFHYSGKADQINHDVALTDVRNNATTKKSIKRELEEYIRIRDEVTSGITRFGDPTPYNEKTLDRQLDKLAKYVYSFHDAEEAAKIFGEKNKNVFEKVQEYIRQSGEASEAYKKQQINGNRTRYILSELGVKETSKQFEEMTKAFEQGGLQAFAEKVKEIFGVEIPLAVKKIGEAIEEQGSVAQQQTTALKAEEQQAEATAQAEKKVAEARQEAPTPTTSTTSKRTTSGTTTSSSIQILTEEELQKELTKVRETIDKEKAIIKELEDELSIEVPKAIKKKNEEFDEEVKKVREDVDKEKAILSELKEYLDTTIPEAIDVKNSKFNEEVGKVGQAINDEIGHLDRLKGELEKPISIDIRKKEEDTFDDSYAFSEAMDRFAKKQQAQHQRKLDNLSALTSELKAKNDERDQDKEIQGVSKLDQALTEIIEKINLKITAFSREEDRVKEVSANEAESLNQIIVKLERIQQLAQTMKSAFQGLKIDGQFDVKGISNLLKFENADFFKVADSLQKLCDALNNLKIGKGSFVNQLNDILAKGKELENLVKILNANEKKIAQAKENTKSEKEKNREDSYKKELDLEKQKLALEKEYRLLEAKGDSKTEEVKAKNLIKINQLEKERKQIVDSRKKGETSQDLRNQINSEIKAIRERNEADIQAEKAAKEVHDQKQRRADKEKAWNTAEKKFNDEKAKAAKEVAKAEAKAAKDAALEQEKAEKVKQNALEQSYKVQKSYMQDINALTINNLHLSDSENEFDKKQIETNNKSIAFKQEEINRIIEERNKLDYDSIELHKDLLQYQEKLNQAYQDESNSQESKKATEQNKKATALYKELYKTAEEYQLLLSKEASGTITSRESERLKELRQMWEDAAQGVNDYQKALKGSSDSIKKYNEVANGIDENLENGRKTLESKLLSEYKTYQKIMSNADDKFTGQFLEDLKAVWIYLNQINDEGLNLETEDDRKKLGDIIHLLEQFDSNASLEKFRKASENSIEKLRLKISKFMQKNSAMGADFMSQFENLKINLDTADSKEKILEIANAFSKLENEVTEADKLGKSLFKTIGEHLKSINAQFIAQYFSFQDIIRYIRTVAETVKTLDSNLTELRKVSDATTERLQESFRKSSETAKELGTNISDVIAITSDWARLGYDVTAAEELARVTTLFRTVGDNMTAESTSSYLISALQGFQMTADQAEHIADVYNEVANNFAIDTTGIGEALQRSAASFNAANTSLEKSVSLVTTANAVVQDPASVGTLWKTLSARLRGAKTELEELGEEEDQFTQTTSKLRDMVKGLTGFDIMKDEDTFKDIYEIMVGIGKEWDKLTDVEQASLGEALAGKRNANALYAVLNNIDKLEEAYDTASNAAGSAQREQENYAKSIEYSLGRLSASWQQLQADLLDSNFVKRVVDIGNTIINIIDKIVSNQLVFTSILATITSTFLTIKGVNIVDIFKSLGSIDFAKLLTNGKFLLSGFLGSTISDTQILKEAFDELNNPLLTTKTAFDSLSKSEKKYAQMAIKSGMSSEEFALSLKSISKGAKIAQAALGALATTAVITAISFVVDAIINYENAISEQTKQATISLNKQKDTILDYSKRVEDLYSKINSGKLTLEENIEANKELRTIQSELINNFGAEAEGLDLVTSSLEQQTEVLKQINELKNSKYLQTEWENAINEDTKYQKALNNLVTYTVGLPKLLSTGEKFSVQSYYSNLEKLVDEYESFTKTFSSTSDAQLNSLIRSFDNIHQLEDGTFEIFGNVDKVKETIVKIQTDYKDFPGFTKEWNDQLTEVYNSANKISTETGDTYKQYMQNIINNNESYRLLKDNIENAYKEYEEAIINGDKNAIDTAIRQYSLAVDAINEATTDPDIKDAIINVVPVIDTGYAEDLMKKDIQSLLDSTSKEYQLFKDYNSVLSISSDAIKSVDKLQQAFANLEQTTKDAFNINDFNDFISILTDEQSEDAINLLNRMKYQGIFSSKGSAGSALYDSGISRSDLSLDFITKDDIRLAGEYFDQIETYFNKFSNKNSAFKFLAGEDEIVEMSELVDKYGKEFLDFMQIIQGQQHRLEWNEWLEVPGFQNALVALTNSWNTTPDVIKQLLLGQNLIVGDGVNTSLEQLFSKYYIPKEIDNTGNYIERTVSKMSNQVEKELKLQDFQNKVADALTIEELEQLPHIAEYLEVPEGAELGIEHIREALSKYNIELAKVQKAQDKFNNSLSAVDAVDAFADAQQAINSLSDIYWETVKKDPNADAEELKYWGIPDPEKINSVEQAFTKLAEKEDDVTKEKLSSALKEFEQTLIEFPGDSEKAQYAINRLVTSYINESEVLKNLTEENKAYATTWMESIGITNAAEVVESRLANTTKSTITELAKLRNLIEKQGGNLDDSIRGTKAYSEAIGSLVENVKSSLAVYDNNGVAIESFELDEEFVKKHLEDIKKMADGDVEAFERVRHEAEKFELENMREKGNIFTDNLSTAEYAQAIDELVTYADQLNDLDIEIGAKLDDTEFINGLNGMLESGKYTTEQVEQLMSNLGYDAIIEEASKNFKIPIIKPDGTTEDITARVSYPVVKVATKKGSYGGGIQANYEATPTNKSGKGGGGGSKDSKTPYEKELEILQKLRDNDVINEKHFLDQKYQLIQKYYAKAGKLDKDYFEKMHEWLKEMLALYNSVISDVTSLIDKKIKRLNEEKDTTIEAYEKEKEARLKQLEEEKKAALDSLDEQIKTIDKRIKIHQEEIEKIQDANDERQRTIQLEKDLYELERAKNQRTLLQYKEGADGKGQLVYTNDPQAIRDQSEKVEQDRYEIRISNMEKEIELLEKQKDKITEQRESTEEYYDNLIKETEDYYQKLIDDTTEYFDSMIKELENYKSKWEELAEIEAEAQARVRLQSLGLNPDDILNMDEASFEAFKENYLGILGDIYKNNEAMSKSFADVFGEMPSYLEKMQPLLDSLENINLSSFEEAMTSVAPALQTIADCLPNLVPLSSTEGFNNLSDAVQAATGAIDGSGTGGTSGKTTGSSTGKTGGGSGLTGALKKLQDQSDQSISSEEGLKGGFEKATESERILDNAITHGLVPAIQLVEGEHDIVFNLKVNGTMPSFNSNMDLGVGVNLDDFMNNTGSSNKSPWARVLDKFHYEGTVGNAFANGYPGLNSPEYSALRSEYGQPELTVYPDGTYELTTTPTLSDLPKDTVIFNEEQTKRILKNSNVNGLKGKSFANGTSYLPLQDVMPDKAELFAKFESNIQANIEKMKNNIADMTSNVRDITRSVTNNMTNNNGNTINVGDINVTCPGVTETEVAKNLGAAIRSELNGVVSGMALRANQLAMRR